MRGESYKKTEVNGLTTYSFSKSRSSFSTPFSECSPPFVLQIAEIKYRFPLYKALYIKGKLVTGRDVSAVIPGYENSALHFSPPYNPSLLSL